MVCISVQEQALLFGNEIHNMEKQKPIQKTNEAISCTDMASVDDGNGVLKLLISINTCRICFLRPWFC